MNLLCRYFKHIVKTMEWLNYHHLYYFWMVSREGGVTPAANLLRLAHPTLSAQIKSLEGALGEKLFRKQGRRLVLTEIGVLVYRYAEDIFSLGRELLSTVKNSTVGPKMKFSVGIEQVVPKLIAKELLDYALVGQDKFFLHCREDRIEQLMTDLANHQLDAVISDRPHTSGSSIRAFSHLLGRSSISFFAASSLVKNKKFPSLLNDLPLLMPMPSTSLRRAIDQWFLVNGIQPRIKAEFDDGALMKVFGQSAAGVFP